MENALLILVRIAEHQERVLLRIEKLLEPRTYPAPVWVTVSAHKPAQSPRL